MTRLMPHLRFKMTRGVPAGIISKRDMVRAWVDQQGWEPVTLEAVKAQYESIDGSPQKWSVYEAKKIIAETHYPTPDDVWVRRKNPRDRQRQRSVLLPPTQPAAEAKAATTAAPINPAPTPVDADFSSWDHPLLATAISTWNTVKATPTGHPDHLIVDFRNREWMNIYARATLAIGNSAGPIDCAVFIAASIADVCGNRSVKTE